MNVAGIGVVFAGGRGINNYDDALRRGWMSPSLIELPSTQNKTFPVYRIELETITDKEFFWTVRRADRFSKMAMIAALDALQDSGIVLDDKKSSLGIIVATAFGPHVTTFRFLDDILNYGDVNVSPTIFSHAVHNAATSYIALVLNSRGPTVTLTQFAFSFHQALILAQIWLHEERCEYVLVGSVDECGTVMNYICSRKLKIAYDGRIKPFHFSASPVAVPGEGSVFFLVARGKCPKRYCEIYGVSGFDNHIEEDEPDMYILDADGMAGGETKYRNEAASDVKIAGYAPLFGSMMTGSGFHCAVGALELKNQIQYACPVQDNPYGANVCMVTKETKIDEISCIRYNCVHERAVIILKR